MTDIITPQRIPNRRHQALGLDVFPASTGAGLSSALEEAWVRNPTPSLLRQLDRARYGGQLGAEDPAGMIGYERPEPGEDFEVLDPEEANKNYGIQGELSFDAPVPEPVAKDLNHLKLEEIERRETMRRARTGLATSITTGLVASVVDPLNVASAFFPVVGGSRYAALVARHGAGRTRAAVGAVEGTVGAAAVEPLVFSVARSEQADYGAADSLMNLAFGTILGAGLHLGAGALGDRIQARARADVLQKEVDSLPRQDQEALLRTAVSQILRDRPVQVRSVFEAARLAPGSPLRSAEAPSAFRVRLEETEEVVPGRSPEQAEVAAREADPQTFERLDAVREEIKTFTARMKELQRVSDENKEINAAAKRIAGINERLQKPNIGRGEAAVLEAELDMLEMSWSDHDFQRALSSTARKSKSKADEVAQVESQISKLRRHQNTLRRRASKARAQADVPPETKVRLRAVVDQAESAAKADPMPEFARTSEQVQERSEPVMGEPRSVEDEEAAVTESLTEYEAMLTPEERTRLKEEMADEEKTTRTYEKAWKLAAACRIRSAGAS